MVALDEPVAHAQPYEGVLSFEQKLPLPQITLPLIVGLIYGLFSILGGLPHPWATSVAGIDDLARLAQARDFANGQGWFDLLQTRLDPPNGVWMHWSRLVDAPIAGLMWLGDLFGAGEAFALLIWPVLLLVVFLVVIALIGRALIGDKGVFFSIFVTFFSGSTLRVFSPGRIDHHNVQIVLSAVLLLSLMRLSGSRRWGIIGGLAAAIMVGIGIETLPIVAAGAAMAAGLWLWDAPRFAGGTRTFGLSFAVSTALVFATSVPASRYAFTQCDSISLTHLVSAVLGGTGIALITWIVPARSKLPVKIGSLGLLVALCGAVAASFFSHCLGDPYAFLDPRLREVWLDNVSEAKSAFTLLAEEPSIFLAAFVPLVVLAMIVGLALKTAPNKYHANWIVLGVFAGVGLCVSLIQVRFVQFTHIYCIPAAAWLMSLAYEAIRNRGATMARVAVFAAVPIVTSSWIVVVPMLVFAKTDGGTETKVETSSRTPENAVVRECQSVADQNAMAAILPGTVVTPIFYGSTVLGLSELPVLSAPYHRAQNAILDTHAIFSNSPEQALPVLRRRNIAYVMICVSSQVRLVTGDQYPDSLTAALENNAPPDWLEPIPVANGSQLHIYRLREAATN